MNCTPNLDGGRIIYVMANYGAPDQYKIGSTSNVRSRYNSKSMRANIVHAIPVPAELNLMDTERKVHRMFADKLVGKDETFRLDAADLEILRALSFEAVPQ